MAERVLRENNHNMVDTSAVVVQVEHAVTGGPTTKRASRPALLSSEGASDGVSREDLERCFAADFLPRLHARYGQSSPEPEATAPRSSSQRPAERTAELQSLRASARVSGLPSNIRGALSQIVGRTAAQQRPASRRAALASSPPPPPPRPPPSLHPSPLLPSPPPLPPPPPPAPAAPLPAPPRTAEPRIRPTDAAAARRAELEEMERRQRVAYLLNSAFRQNLEELLSLHFELITSGLVPTSRAPPPAEAPADMAMPASTASGVGRGERSSGGGGGGGHGAARGRSDGLLPVGGTLPSREESAAWQLALEAKLDGIATEVVSLGDQSRQMGQLLASGFSLSLSLHEQLTRTTTALCTLSDRLDTTAAAPVVGTDGRPAPPQETGRAAAEQRRPLPPKPPPSKPPVMPPSQSPPGTGGVSDTGGGDTGGGTNVSTLLLEMCAQQAELVRQLHALRRRRGRHETPLKPPRGGNRRQRKHRSPRDVTGDVGAGEDDGSAADARDNSGAMLEATVIFQSSQPADGECSSPAVSAERAPIDALQQLPARPRPGQHARGSASRGLHHLHMATVRPPTTSAQEAVPPALDHASPKGGGTCLLCLENAADAVLYRCGHRCACLRCAHYLRYEKQPCPLCRSPIDDVIRVYD